MSAELTNVKSRDVLPGDIVFDEEGRRHYVARNRILFAFSYGNDEEEDVSIGLEESPDRVWVKVVRPDAPIYPPQDAITPIGYAATRDDALRTLREYWEGTPPRNEVNATYCDFELQDVEVVYQKAYDYDDGDAQYPGGMESAANFAYNMCAVAWVAVLGERRREATRTP